MTDLTLIKEKINRTLLILLPLLPVIFFLFHNLAVFSDLIIKVEVLKLLLVYCVFSYSVCLILYKVTKLTFTASICLGTIFITLFLFFGVFQDFLITYIGLQIISNSFTLLFTFLFTFIYWVVISKKKNRTYNKLNKFLLILYAVLITYEITHFITDLIDGKNARMIAQKMVEPINFDSMKKHKEKPDIYYIIFDGYTNPSSLRQFWNYENEIVPYLKSKKFFVADSSFSNYKSTPFSISSVLNMQYLDNAAPYLYSNSYNFLIGRLTYLNNNLYRFLSNQGYKFTNFSQLETEKQLTTFGFLGVEAPEKWLRRLTVERIFLNPWLMHKSLGLFQKRNHQPSGIKKSMDSFLKYNDLAKKHIFSSCQDSKSSVYPPIFNFTHFMIPHDPYQVDENGVRIRSAVPGGSDMNGYLKQIKYSNKIIKEITDCIFRDTIRNKIIIIQGDHGYRHYSNARIKEQFSALNCLYFYNQDYSGLTNNFSHVNTFRIVMNNFFNGSFSMLKDSIFQFKKNKN